MIFKPCSAWETGCAGSVRTDSAANSSAARTSPRESRGWDATRSSTESPPASSSRMCSTVIRVPRTIGLPSMSAGSEVMRDASFMRASLP